MSQDALFIDETLNKIEFLFKITGYAMETKHRSYTQKFLLYLNFVSLNLEVAAALYFLIDGIVNGENFVNLTYSAPCITFCILSIVKFLAASFNADEANQLINVLRNMEIQNKEHTSRESQMIVKEERSFLHRLLKALNFVYCFLIIGFTLNPIMVIGINYLKHGRLMLVLPFLAKYPFDWDNLEVWPVLFVMQVWSVIVVILYLVMVDYLFYIYSVYIRIQFRLLQHALESMCSGTENRAFKEVAPQFRKLVMWHTKLIESTQKLEDIYTKSTLCNYVTSSILICLTGFDIMVITDVMVVISFVTFLFTSLLQIFLLCFFGDLLMASSIEVSDAVYNSQWYLKESAVVKNLIIVMVRSQRGCRLTAYNFADVNLTSFMRILKNAWSYFALLKTVYGLK